MKDGRAIFKKFKKTCLIVLVFFSKFVQVKMLKVQFCALIWVTCIKDLITNYFGNSEKKGYLPPKRLPPPTPPCEFLKHLIQGITYSKLQGNAYTMTSEEKVRSLVCHFLRGGGGVSQNAPSGTVLFPKKGKKT